MRHRRRVKHFSRKSTARVALLRGLMVSLVEHGRISTTVDKAKEVRRHIEKAVTVGKGGDLATRRLLLSRIANKNAVSEIVDNISPRFKTRPGGYTRIIKIGRRPGDTAEMAFLEFVDYDYTAKTGKKEAAEKTETKSKKAAKAAPKKAKQGKAKGKKSEVTATA